MIHNVPTSTTDTYAPHPDWHNLYLTEVRLRYRDRRYANAEHQRRLANVVADFEKQLAELRAVNTAIRQDYADLLAVVNTVHRQDRTYRKSKAIVESPDTLPDFASMTEDQRIQFFRSVEVKA